MTTPLVEALLQKIERKEAKVGVLGLGYVGLPLAVQFAKAGVPTLGFEKDALRAKRVNDAQNYIGDVEDADLKSVCAAKTLEATTDFSRIKECDAIIICVPTPLDKFKKPDMSFIEAASIDIGRNMKAGTFIALESTTYPTTTEDFILPIVERESKLKACKDFWLCFSAERVDPGNKDYKTHNTPKVVGGMGADAQRIAMALYSKAISSLYPVSSPKVAEMTKILENTYRLINISMINELALLCGKMGIDIWEVIDAAKTKPYGFQAFYPGPGIGGHCIPLDPFYLEHIAKNYNFDLTMINTAGHVDNLMPHRMVIKISSALNRQKKAINGSNILFLGVAYKADIDDMRESPALRILDEIEAKGGVVSYHDPHVPSFRTDHGRGKIMESVPLNQKSLEAADCVVVTTRHTSVNYALVAQHARCIVDLRNAYDRRDGAVENVHKL
ncbi:MAG: nucleotide sugar dehydrogenase [Silvanigrellales bacterium]|jgi:UDP-N-acetyl-D-glucosamine dehydrogenase|nr:nucleotide sugar dehydrogenase [Silvanigrellales bacterium]